MNESLDPYEKSGVDYVVLDAAKRVAQEHARSTADIPLRLGARLDEASRGEPATVVRIGGVTLGFVLECLGTKSMIASAYEAETGLDRFSAIGYDVVAAAVNDCCCVGAAPFVVNAYFATGSASFYADTRHRSLAEGFARGCVDAGAAWGGGESPTLSGLIAEHETDLAASAVGIVPEGVEPLLGEALHAGDAIVLVASSGLHANGASLARQVATELADGLSTRLPSGRLFGDALLDESIIYVPLVAAVLKGNLGLHYVSHITGHGLRKLMRANREFTYRVNALPRPPEVLRFLVERAGLSPKDAYGTLNMGAGLALFVDGAHAAAVVELAAGLGYEALVAGAVEEGPRKVVLDPIGCTYESFELELR